MNGIDLISRRNFVGLLLQSALATTALGQAIRPSQPYYTPPSDFGGGWQFTPDPRLPNVLLIGDSISIGYTRDVRRLLSKQANIFRPMTTDGSKPDNCGDTRYGLEHIDRWLGEETWSIIHFNWGLHDLCYRNPQSKLYGHRDKVHGVLSVPLPDYRSNLIKLVQIIKKTNAKPIWATTTVIPPNEAGRFMGDEVKYNRAAAEILGDSSRTYHTKRGGDVLHCVHALETSAGCGHASSCSDCVIRNSVRRVLEGSEVHRRSLTMKTVTGGEQKDIPLLVTVSPLKQGDEKLTILVMEDLSELHQLRRLLPICAWCKKIRNDEDYWQSLEEYLGSHHDIRFTHGMCEDCYRKMHQDDV